MFSQCISNGWFSMDRNSRAYLDARLHIDALFETLGVYINIVETPEQITEIVNEIADDFITRFDTKPSNPTIKLDPFLMALYCDYILSMLPNEAAALPRTAMGVNLISKVKGYLYAYCHVSTTSKFLSQRGVYDTCGRELAFAMISHRRLGCRAGLSRDFCRDIMTVICNHATIDPKTQSGQRLLISSFEREQYINFVKSEPELRDLLNDNESAWGAFLQRFKQ